jgi:DNA-binding transcriptional LysR family regulator
MPTSGPFSLDHLQVLLTVAETGSFAAAARRLNRANSAISYAIDTLETQLGLTLFVRGSTRRPTLTREGEAVVAEARSVAHGADMLRARVKGLLEGLEAELSLMVDEMFPEDRLVEALKAFSERYPTVPVRLGRAVLESVDRLVRGGDWTIGIGGLFHIDSRGLQRVDLGAVRLIPVAVPSHPLASAGPACPGDTREYLQLVLSEHFAPSDREHGVVGAKVWRVGDLPSKLALLRAGLGWGGMPEPMVRGDVEAGRLVHLDLADWRGGEYPLAAVSREDSPPGPAGRWLTERLVEQAGSEAYGEGMVPRGGIEPPTP